MEEKKNFEQSLKELEGIVDKLQSGDIELEKAYTLFEEGMKLAKECEQKLTNIEQKLTKMLKENQLCDFTEVSEVE